MGSGGKATAIGAGLDLMTGGTGVFTSMGKAYDSHKQAKKERKIANQQIAREQAAIAEQKKAALAERKAQIDSMRANMIGGGRETRSSTKTKGIRANIQEDSLG